MSLQPAAQIPDGTLQAAPVAPPVAPPEGGTDKLERILPQLRELAQKVGGFGKLGEIVQQLDRNGE
jgi:hypothetical protein